MNEADWFLAAAPWIGAGLAAISLRAAVGAGRRNRLLDDLPTSKAQGVFIGLVELKGTAEEAAPGGALRSYLAEIPCVHYAWRVEEHWSRTVTTTDSKGNRVTRRESGWTTMDEGDQTVEFLLRDGSGAILVHPQGAKIESKEVFHEHCRIGDPLYYGKGPPGACAHSDRRRRFTEIALPLHQPIYLVGQSRAREDVAAAEIAYDPRADLYLISVRPEEEVSAGYQRGFWGLALLGLVLAVGGLVLADKVGERRGYGYDLDARLPAYFMAGGAYLAAWLAAAGLMIYNSVVGLRQRVAQGWSQVDVMLKRRADLIPNLIATVQALKDHERDAHTLVADLRGQLRATPPWEAGGNFHALGARVVALAERYPSLRTDDAFLNLQKQLIDTEDRIALARAYYNDIATFYNTRLEIFPDGLLARLTGMEPRALMRADGFEQASVQVRLQE